MNATERLQHLGTLFQRCEAARLFGDSEAEHLQAGLVAAAVVLLPEKQWEAFRLQAELADERIRALLALFPQPKPETETEPIEA